MARMNFAVLTAEITGDPLGRGYSGMSDKAVANDLNTTYRTRVLDVLNGGAVYEQVDVSEFAGLTDAQRAEVWDIVHLGASIPVGPGSKARSRFVSIFGGGSTTISNLAAATTQSISRAEELGLPAVREGDVIKARS